jgi:uncharacterized membrane protein
MSIEDTRGAEVALGRVLTVGSRVSTVCLAAGLLLTFALPGSQLTAILLAVGLVVLMVTPVARVALSIAEFARRRDWRFVIYASVVFALLIGSFAAAVR